MLFAFTDHTVRVQIALGATVSIVAAAAATAVVTAQAHHQHIPQKAVAPGNIDSGALASSLMEKKSKKKLLIHDKEIMYSVLNSMVIVHEYECFMQRYNNPDANFRDFLLSSTTFTP